MYLIAILAVSLCVAILAGVFPPGLLLFALSLLAGTLIYTLCAERPAKG